ncbi:MAG: hypothetical protein JRI98_14665 [Deltaproteobacteria bacterium]|nr:hypothetical protein [Deltaproteobacteria bacterium]
MATWLQRRRAHRRLTDEVGLWYHPQYKAEALIESARVPGIEVARGEKILGSLGAEGLLRPKQVRPAPLITIADLAKVHADTYLDKTARPEYLGRIFGLEAHDPLLIAQRRQVGGTVEAARWVLGGQLRIGFNIGGGFHHAEPEAGAGFCVYNDIAVAIAALRADGFDAPIAVWSHVEAAADTQVLLPSKTDDEAYLGELRETLPASLEAIDPGLIFYIAGNDVLRGDRLGEFMLTREGVLERDCFVIELARKHRCPVVITLGGGYSDDAWRSSTDFIRWLLTDEARVSGEPRTSVYEQYAQIAQELDPQELQRPSGEWVLTEADLMGDLTGPRYKSMRLLDYYSRHGIEFALEQYGVADEVRDLGFTDLELAVDPSDPDRQHLTLRAKKDGEEHLLVDQVLRRLTRPAPEGLDPPDDIRLLYIEWMMLQNPTETFSLRHPQWPGQDHPGLGIGEKVMHMLFQGAQRLDLDGLAHHPSRYHIAFIGGGQSFFLDPEIQGRFEAIREVLAPLDLSEAAWKMERAEVCWSDGEPVEWIPEDIVIPASERLFAYIGSVHYQQPRAEALERARERGIVLEPTRRTS